jgi:hypothetical protein
MKNKFLKLAVLVGIPAVLFAAESRIKDFASTATSAAGDDYVPLDGATNGTRKMLAARFLTNATVTGTGNVVQNTSPTFPGNLTITGNATPSTTTAGTISFDTNAWAASRGSFQAYDGTANIILLGALASDTPSNGQVATWNTNGTITWETVAGSGNVTNNATLSAGNITIGGGTTVISTSNVSWNATNNTLTSPNFIATNAISATSINTNRQAHGAAGATETFDMANGDTHTATLDANLTVTLTGWSASGTMSSMFIGLTQNGTGGYTVTWPAAVVVAPTVTTTANAITWVSLWTIDGGTTVYASSTADGVPIGSVSGLGTGVATALAINVGSAGAPVVLNGAAGTPSSITLTNGSGLPIAGLTNSTLTTLGVGALEFGHASDTSIVRVGAGQISVEGVNVVTLSSTDTLTNKTFDAAATGNVLKQKGYVYLTHPHLADGTNATISTTATSIAYGHATFSHSVDQASNYVEYYIQIPEDIDTSVALRARLKVLLGGADTGTQRYVLSTVSVADSAVPTSSTLANAINVDFGGDGSGANGDVETSAWTTLTSWASALTAGQTWRIRLARDGDTSDSSTVNSTELGLVIEYGITQ